MYISGAFIPGYVWRRNASGGLWTYALAPRPSHFCLRLHLLGGARAAALWLESFTQESRTARPSPQIKPLDRPPRYSENATIARPRALYSHSALPACRVGRKCRARTVRRDERRSLGGIFAIRGIRFRDEIPPFGGPGYSERCLFWGHLPPSRLGELMRLWALGTTRRRQGPRISQTPPDIWGARRRPLA